MKNLPIYYEAARYTCTACGYETEVYSDEEWLSECTDTAESIFPAVCVTCGRMHMTSFDPCLLFRADVVDADDGYPFHPQPASLPDNKANICKECLGVDSLHWTEKVMSCKRCDKYTMRFKSYVPGTHMEVFREYAVKLANTDTSQFERFRHLNEYGEYEPQKPISPETRLLFSYIYKVQEQLCEQGNIYSIEALYEDTALLTYVTSRVTQH
jgi:hypothetical protein